jgi:hypothetical protein
MIEQRNKGILAKQNYMITYVINYQCGSELLMR